MNYPYEKTGKRIFQLRKSKNLTREQLAEKADISIQFLADIEKGRKNMTVTTLRKLAFALSVTTDFIVNGDEHFSPLQHELTTLYSELSPENQDYALQILRTFVKAINSNYE